MKRFGWKEGLRRVFRKKVEEVEGRSIGFKSAVHM